jgi:hypothetical protein
MSEVETKVSIAQVEQSLMQALKKATEAGYSSKEESYISSNLNAVDVYSSALQRILASQR